MIFRNGRILLPVGIVIVQIPNRYFPEDLYANRNTQGFLRPC